jgi:hypothetical protein
MRFQVGVPAGLDITLTSMKPSDAIRYAKAFNQRIALEVNEILKEGGDDVIIQVEVPIEMGVADRLPGFLSWIPAKAALSLIKRFHSGARVGIHICLGDLNNTSLVPLTSVTAMVRFSSSLVSRWPSHLVLEYIHYPLAEGSVPPRTDPAFYRPLSKIRLPDSTRFIAGFIHEKLDHREHIRVLRTIEKIRGSEIGVASSCGLGRRSPSAAERIFDLTRSVAEAGTA